jgi:hypothetical protein
MPGWTGLRLLPLVFYSSLVPVPEVGTDCIQRISCSGHQAQPQSLLLRRKNEQLKATDSFDCCSVYIEYRSVTATRLTHSPASSEGNPGRGIRPDVICFCTTTVCISVWGCFFVCHPRVIWVFYLGKRLYCSTIFLQDFPPS